MTGKNQNPTKKCPPRKAKDTMVSTSSKPSTRSSNRVTKSKAVGSYSAAKATKQQPAAKSTRRAKRARSPTPENDEDEGLDDDEQESKPTKKKPKRGGARKTRGTATAHPPTTRSRRGLASSEKNAAANGEATAPIPSATTQTDQTTTARDPPATTPAAESSQTQTQTDEELAWALHRAESESSGRNQRSLRSRTGGVRFQFCELSLFFPNYDEIMGIQPKEAEFLEPDAEILVIDDEDSQTDDAQGPSWSDVQWSEGPRSQPVNEQHHDHPNEGGADHNGAISPLLSPSAAPSAAADLWNVQQVDLSSAEGEGSSAGNDPLAETMYLTAHHRVEQREKRLQNIEKAKAQHEKESLERILEGLKGPDWLRVIGVSGVTGSEKQSYIPKRAYFIQEVIALIEKFKAWADEQKRRKLGKGKRESAKEEEKGKKADKGKRAVRPGRAESTPEAGVNDDDETSDGGSPQLSDADAEAARQLHLEASMAAGSAQDEAEADQPGPSEPRGTKRKRGDDPASEPITSFFSKRHQRDAALGSHRRSGRGALAFGQPIPDMPEQEFQLPEDILTEQITSTRARLRRRLKRGTGAT